MLFISAVADAAATVAAGSSWRRWPWLLVVGALHLAVVGQRRERHERNDAAIVDVGARHGDGPVGGHVLDDLEDVLRPRRTDRRDHGAAGLQLLQQRRRDMVDAASDDDLVEGRVLLPAVV